MAGFPHYSRCLLAVTVIVLAAGCLTSLQAGTGPSPGQSEYDRCVALLDTQPCAPTAGEPTEASPVRFWKDGDIVVVEVYRASTSTDWEQWTTSCFDSDHELVAIDMRLTTRHGNVFVVEHRIYGPDETVVFVKKVVRDLFTNELRNDDPDSYDYHPPETAPTLAALLGGLSAELPESCIKPVNKVSP